MYISVGCPLSSWTLPLLGANFLAQFYFSTSTITRLRSSICIVVFSDEFTFEVPADLASVTLFISKGSGVGA